MNSYESRNNLTTKREFGNSVYFVTLTRSLPAQSAPFPSVSNPSNMAAVTLAEMVRPVGLGLNVEETGL